MLIHRFEVKAAILPTASKWFAAVTIACLTGVEHSLYAQDCEAIHNVISFNAAEGLLPNEMTPAWLTGCGHSQWIDGEILGNVLHVLDNSNQTSDPPNGLRSAYCQYDVFDCSIQDAVFEVVGQAELGANSTPPHNIDIVWFSGFQDLEKSLTIAITANSVGFHTSTSPVDWLSSDGKVAKFDLDTTDTLHTYRVEKHGQSQAKLFVDDQLRVTWDYAELGNANGPNRAHLSTTSSPGVSEFSIESFRYRIGATSFDFDPSVCDADLNGDGTVNTSDLLNLFASWGPCDACGADLDGDGIVGTSDLLIIFSLWGPLDEGCIDDDGPSYGNIIVTGDACDPEIPPSAYNIVDLGNNHFDVYLQDLYAPYSTSFFELHPTSDGLTIEHLFIDVEGPPAGSPVVIRVLPSCNNSNLKFNTVNNILEIADGEHLLNRVDVAGDVGLIIVEAIGDILLGGDVTDDIIATTPDNNTRGITKVKAVGNIYGDILAPFGRIAFISAEGDIGTPQSPILIEAKHYFSNITKAHNLYAHINGHVNDGTGAISMIYVDRFVGSLNVRTMSSQPSGGLLHFAVELDAPITFVQGYTGSNRTLEVPVGGLTTQIIFNADNIPGAVWDAPVKIGFDGDPEQVILTGPGYTYTAQSLGGGSIGLAPFDLHDESCEPSNGETVLHYRTDPPLVVKLRHYGPIALNANTPLTIERRNSGSTDPFSGLSPTNFVFNVDPTDNNSLLVTAAPGKNGFEAGYEYKLIATANLMCDQVMDNPPVIWDSLDYRITVISQK
ncbi:MAG: hypothetical protein IH984_13145 [Planctomycetes bacterium]|nr:hypothetical protein [Planctomycetota bacterium]